MSGRSASFGLVGLTFLAALAASPADAQADNAACLECHGSREAGAPEVPKDVFGASVHGGLDCVSCHDQAAGLPHPDHMPRPACADCHSDQAAEHAKSVHGEARARGDRDAPACQACHEPAHQARPARDPRSSIFAANLPRTCGRCHGDPGLARRHGIKVENPLEMYLDSIHGRAVTQKGDLVAANCSTCHGTHAIRPAADTASSVNHANVPATCGQCHAEVLATYAKSIHGQRLAGGDMRVAVCSDCHTAHHIAPVADPRWQRDVVQECGTCHTQSMRTFRDTFHGQIGELGFTRVARCADCHGHHDIQPRADATSRVNERNRLATCRRCHADANQNFAKYDPHADAGDRHRNPTYWITAKFMTSLLWFVFAFFGAHTGLWGYRAWRSRGGEKRAPGPKAEDEA